MLNSFSWFNILSGGKKKPLKQPKKDDKELDEVCSLYICIIVKYAA